MVLRGESIVGDIGMYGESIAKDPVLGAHARSILPLTGRIGTERTTRKILGEGAFGRVNLESNAHGNVATKYFTSPTHLCENVTEIATLKFLKGLPNVAQLIRVEPRPGFPAAVMGMAVGTLDDSRRLMSWDGVFSTIKQVLSGFQVLRSQNIAHRDIKPGNMLMTVTGEVWITDFGMSCYIPPHALMPMDLYTGTYPYAAPELLMMNLRRPASPVVDFFKSDAWAVGASLYEILTNTYLFDGETMDEIFNSVVRIKGPPTEEDGIVYTLFRKSPKRSDPFRPSGIRERCLTRTLFKPRDMRQLELVADIISGLCAYNPDSRLTMEQALQRLNVVAFKKTIARMQVEYTASAAIGSENIATLFDWLKVVAHEQVGNVRQRPFVMDRMCVFIHSFFTAYPETPRGEFQLVGIAGFFLANCLFGCGSDIRRLLYLCVGRYTDEQFNACIHKYIVSDEIDFFGTTVFDQILQKESKRSEGDKLTDHTVATYGFLNMECFQNCVVPPDLARFKEYRDTATSGESRDLLGPFFGRGGRRFRKKLTRSIRSKMT